MVLIERVVSLVIILFIYYINSETFASEFEENLKKIFAMLSFTKYL